MGGSADLERRESDWGRGWRAWALAFALSAPVVALYLAHLFGAPPGTGPSGFIQYDQLYYMANAREIADGGHWLTYGNAFGPDYTAAPVYFQPVAALLGVALRFTGADPGALYVAFGAASVLACLRLAVALLVQVVPLTDASARLAMLLFAWGGGLLTAAGVLRGTLVGEFDPFFYDPAVGFWFLNLGRNLILPIEAFHHALFLGAVLLVLGRRWDWALGVAAVLSASHPFTGVELLGILFGWSALERVALRRREVPLWFPAALAGLILAHAGYYLMFLPRDPNHASLFAQWRAFDAVAPLISLLLAYALVGFFALLRIRRDGGPRVVFAAPRERLFALWFLGAFALAKNDLVMAPIQPLHFTRGYDWMPLFLLGAPALVATLRTILAPGTLRAGLAAASLAFIFLFDNLAWFGIAARATPAVWLTADERAFFAWASEPAQRGTVVLADPVLSYTMTAYTPLRGWFTHRFNTPFADRRGSELAAFLDAGALPATAAPTHFLIVRDAARDQNPRAIPAGARAVYQRGGIAAWEIAR